METHIKVFVLMLMSERVTQFGNFTWSDALQLGVGGFLMLPLNTNNTNYSSSWNIQEKRNFTNGLVAKATSYYNTQIH